MTQRRPPSTEDVAVARKILVANAGIVAFVPASSTFDTWPVVLRLGRALHAVSGSPLGLIRSPKMALEKGRPKGPAPEAGDFQVQEIASETGLSEVVLPPVMSYHEAAANLAQTAPKVGGRFGHLLIDLAGFLPDAREVLDVPDALVSAAIAGHTRETALRALVELLPTSRHLGTLLLDSL
jgi:hypothetical protein